MGEYADEDYENAYGELCEDEIAEAVARSKVMSETKFTPGPWRVIRTGPCGPASERFWVGKDAPNPEWRGPSSIGDAVQNMDHVFEGNGRDTGEAKANAHLIAAAPEMFSALEIIIKSHDESIQRGGDGLLTYDQVREARLAISKAKGEL